ncbi:zinc finger, CCHC-type containing protein, partial [Tanacetum coccineum]
MTNTQTPPPVTTVVNTTGAPVTNIVANHAEKPKKFNSQNFKRWLHKMFFYLTTLGLARFLKEIVPQVEPPTEGQSSNTQARGFLSDGWRTHKRKEMSVEDLVVRLRIEEDNRFAQKDTNTPDSAKANIIEHAGSSSRSNPKGNGKEKKKNDKKSKGKFEYLALKAGIVKQKFQGTCYNCDQPGHRAANCKMLKRVNSRLENIVNDDVDMIAMVSGVCAMISEVNLVEAVHGQFCNSTKAVHRQFCNSRQANMVNDDVDMIVMVSDVCAMIYEVNLEAVQNAISANGLDIKEKRDVYLKMTLRKTQVEQLSYKRQRDENDLQDERQDQTEEVEVEPRRSKRARNEKSFRPDFVSFMVENEPTSYQEAVTSSEGKQWKEAIKSEIESILQNHTWELVDLPPGCKLLGYK